MISLIGYFIMIKLEVDLINVENTITPMDFFRSLLKENKFLVE